MMTILHRSLLTFITVILLAACSNSSAPQNSASAQLQSARVEVSPKIWVNLPTPSQLGYTLTASQLVSVQYQHGEHQLPTQLQVKQQRLDLAGFSSWGARILSLSYQGNNIESQIMTGLSDTLPKPEQVLFYLMITLWPQDAWQDNLAAIDWQLIDSPDGLSRELIDDSGSSIANIRYQNRDPLQGDISFTHNQLDFTIQIKTLQYQKPQAN